MLAGALDAGGAFGGMGASREMTIAPLVEPVLMMVVPGMVLVAFASGVAWSMGSRVPVVGTAAEDFQLVDLSGKMQSLSQYRGKSNVILAFYIFAFTGG